MGRVRKVRVKYEPLPRETDQEIKAVLKKYTAKGQQRHRNQERLYLATVVVGTALLLALTLYVANRALAIQYGI